MLIFEKNALFSGKKIYFWSKTKNAYTPGGSYIISLKQSILVINSQQQPFESLRVMTLGDVDRH